MNYQALDHLSSIKQDLRWNPHPIQHPVVSASFARKPALVRASIVIAYYLKLLEFRVSPQGTAREALRLVVLSLFLVALPLTLILIVALLVLEIAIAVLKTLIAVVAIILLFNVISATVSNR